MIPTSIGPLPYTSSRPQVLAQRGIRLHADGNGNVSARIARVPRITSSRFTYGS